MKKFYKCIRGIDEYKSNTHYFITGKIYKCAEEITDLNLANLVSLIDELGDNHYILFDIFETHFKPLVSNKRHRNDKEGR